MIEKYLNKFSLSDIDTKFKYDIFKNNVGKYDKKIKLNFSSGHLVEYNLLEYDNVKDKYDGDDLKYKLINSNNIEQIPMIKLFMVIYLVRSYIEYERRDDKYIFKFYLNDKDNKKKKIKISVNNKIMTNNNRALFIWSSNEIDYILFKALVKICNLFELNIRDVDISQLVGICSKSNIGCMKLKNLNTRKEYFYIDSELNSKKNLNINELKMKILQDKWLSNNMFEIIMNKTVDPINEYSKYIYEMFRLDMIVGITMGSNFLFIIDDMFVSELGELEMNMLNIFTGKFIKFKIGSLINNIDKIILKL